MGMVNKAPRNFCQVMGITFSFIFLLHCAYFNLFYNARAFFKEGVRLYSSSPYQAKEKFTKAKEKALLTIKKYPRSRYVPEALFLAGAAHYYLQEYTPAKERLTLFLSFYPKHKLAAEAKYYTALANLAEGERGTGIRLLRELAQENKREEKRVRYKIYSTLLEAGEVRLMIDSLIRFISDFPGSKEAQSAKSLLANAYFSQGNFITSQKYYEEIFREAGEKKERASALLKIGECLLKRADCPAETFRFFIKRLSEIDETFSAFGLKPAALLLKGKILFRLNEAKEGIATLKQVRGGATGAESYFLIGEYYESQGDFKAALIYYDTAKSFSAGQDFGVMADKKKRLIEHLTKSDSLSPAERNFALAELYLLSLGRPKEAIKEYEEVFTRYPKDSLAPKSLYACAWIKKFILKEENGDSLFLKLIALYPNTEYAKEGKRLLKGDK